MRPRNNGKQTNEPENRPGAREFLLLSLDIFPFKLLEAEMLYRTLRNKDVIDYLDN